MGGLVVALPEAAEGELAADVPEFEVHVWEGDGSDVLADGGDGVAGCWVGFVGGGGGEGGGGGRVVKGFDLVEESGFAGIVEAKEED